MNLAFTSRRYVPVALYVLALVLYIAAALAAPGPATADAAFYASAANEIVHGHFSVNFLWSFNEVGAVIPSDPHLPIPIGGHWLPGAALLAAPLVWLLGSAWPIPALGSVLTGALAAPVAWRLALDLEFDRRLALGAGIIVALGGALLPFLGQPDNHAISAGLGSLCLLLAGRAARGSGRALVGAALAGAAMMLVRNDGLLYLVPLAVAAWLGRHSLSRRAVAGATLVVAVVLGSWWAHQLIVFGSLSPSAAGGRSLWILTLDEFNGLGRLTPADLLAHGAPAIIASRLTGLWNVVLLHGVFFAVGGVLVPFALYGALARRRERVIKPTLAFAGAFIAAAVLVFPAHVPNGMYLRSGAALLPVTIVLGLAGLSRLVSRLTPAARVRPVIGAILASIVSIQLGLAVLAGSITYPSWNQSASQWAWVKDQLAAMAGPDDRLETYDAASAWWYTAHPAVVTPNGNEDDLRDVAAAYDIDWLVVLRGQTVPATQSLLEGASWTWLGPEASRLVAPDGRVMAVIYPISAP